MEERMAEISGIIEWLANKPKGIIVKAYVPFNKEDSE
jgi:hypothetical protein